MCLRLYLADKANGENSQMNQETADRLGREIIAFLSLRVKRNGRVDTTWGDKSPEGLARTLQRIINTADQAEGEATK